MARVLIVDDEKCNAGILSLVVTQLGHEPIEAYSGQHAIDSFSEYQPDLILLDYMMPGINGLMTLHQIRQLPGGKRPAALLITASQLRSVEEEAKSVGVVGFLRKPLNLNTLKALIDEHCGEEEYKASVIR
jgi:two-component system chemotaxis response regulator CheY